jgi:hypothetical protein
LRTVCEIKTHNQFLPRSYDKDHKIHTHFSKTMMASAEDNNAMPPEPLVAPLNVDPTQRFAGGYAMQNRGQNRSPAAQIGVRRRRRGQQRGGGAAAARGGANPTAGGGRCNSSGARDGGVGGGRSSFLCSLLLTRDGKSRWTPLHIAVCNRDPVTMLLLLSHRVSANSDGCGG